MGRRSEDLGVVARVDGSGAQIFRGEESIETPTTVVWGDLDIPAMIDRCRELADRLPAAGEPVVLAGVAHLPGLERPREVAEVIASAIGP